MMEDEAQKYSDKVILSTDDGSKGYMGLDFLKELCEKKNSIDAS